MSAVRDRVAVDSDVPEIGVVWCAVEEVIPLANNVTTCLDSW